MNPTREESSDQRIERRQGIVSFLTGQQVPVKDDILVSINLYFNFGYNN